MPIQTQRLILRNYAADDFDHQRELDSDPAALRYRSRQAISPEDSREFIQRALRSIGDQPRLLYAYVVVQRDGMVWSGQVGLTVTSLAAIEAFAWYSLLPCFWGQGLAAEALRALLYAGATRFGLKRIIAECHPDNHASVRVMEKAGMRYEGLEQVPLSGGGFQGRLRYSLDGDDLAGLSSAGIEITPPV